MNRPFDELNTPCNCEGRGFYTRAQIDEMLQDILDPDAIENILNQMFTEYITEGDLYNLIINAIGDVYSQEQIDAMLADMATRTWVQSQGYLTEHQDLSDYALTTAVTESISAATATTTGWVESQGYLTEHQSLDGYATDADLASIYNMIANLQTQINDCCSGDTPVVTTGLSVEITYNVTSTTVATPIVNSLEGIESIKTTGGTDIPLAVSYTFSETGPQTLVFKFPNVVTANKFRLMDNIIAAKVEPNVNLGYCVFGSTPLTSVTFEAGSKTPMTTQFYGCSALTQVNGIENSAWEILPVYCFSGCTSLAQDITLPDTIHTIDRQAFAYAPIRNLVINEGCQVVGRASVTNITGYIRFMGSTPPYTDFVNEHGLVNFNGNYPIYVPAGAVSAYQAAYPEIASRIQAWS